MTEVQSNDQALLEEASSAAKQLTAELNKVIIGQERILRLLLTSVFSEGHALIIGVPGLAKTLLVRTLSQAMDLSFKRIQFTPDMMPSDILGMELLQEDEATGQRQMTFVKGPIFANMILADEINRTPPKTQSALLEAMQERTITSMGHTYTLTRPFLVVATQNPIEQEGTYPLPEAQLDRFMFSLWIDYPTEDEERAIVRATTQPREVEINQVITQADLVKYQDLARRIPASDAMIDYAVAIARATRPDNPDACETVKHYVSWGAGPRAGQYMIIAAKTLAMLDGKVAVNDAHVREAAQYVLRHRVIPNYHASGDGLGAEQIINKVIESVDVVHD